MTDPELQPFKLTPDPDLYYTSPEQLSVYSELFSAIHMRRGTVLLTGESGTGKTMLLHRIARDLRASGCEVRLFSNAIGSTDEFLKACCEALGLTIGRQNPTMALREALEINSQAVLVLLIDEADGIDDTVLRDIVELSSRDTGDGRLIQTLLTAAPDFKLRLEALKLVDLVRVRRRLHPIRTREVEPFIRHRLRESGFPNEDVFAQSAFARIAHHSKGYPGRINAICASAMFHASEDGLEQIDANLIDELVDEQFEAVDEQAARDTQAAGAAPVVTSDSADADHAIDEPSGGHALEKLPGLFDFVPEEHGHTSNTASDSTSNHTSHHTSINASNDGASAITTLAEGSASAPPEATTSPPKDDHLSEVAKRDGDAAWVDATELAVLSQAKHQAAHAQAYNKVVPAVDAERNVIGSPPSPASRPGGADARAAELELLEEDAQTLPSESPPEPAPTKTAATAPENATPERTAKAFTATPDVHAKREEAMSAIRERSRVRRVRSIKVAALTLFLITAVAFAAWSTLHPDAQLQDRITASKTWVKDKFTLLRDFVSSGTATEEIEDNGAVADVGTSVPTNVLRDPEQIAAVTQGMERASDAEKSSAHSVFTLEREVQLGSRNASAEIAPQTQDVPTPPEPALRPITAMASSLVSRDARGGEDVPLDLYIGSSAASVEREDLIEVTGVPADARLSRGHLQDGVWLLTATELEGLELITGANSDADLTLSIKLVHNVDGRTLAENELRVDIEAVADEPDVAVFGANGDQYSSIPLQIEATLTDTDGSENLSIIILGVPSGTTLSNGELQSDGSWFLTLQDLNELVLTPGQGAPAQIELTVTVIATESSNGDAATVTQPLVVSVVSAESDSN